MLTEKSVDSLVEKYKHAKMKQREYESIMSSFVNGIPESIPPSKITALISTCISSACRQMYLNEVRSHLLSHNTELHQKYAACFADNPGCFEAFGVRGEARTLKQPAREKKSFKSLQPQLHISKSRTRSVSLKKTIHRKNREAAYRKTMDEKKAAAEYKKKMSTVLARMRKNE